MCRNRFAARRRLHRHKGSVVVRRTQEVIPPVRPLRAASVGVPEVLGLSFPGNAEAAKVRALLLGTRIDTRNVRSFGEPDALILDGIGAAFVFRYGVLVLFDATPERERDLIISLDGHVIEPM